jgi:hypothetical protein
MDSIDKNPDILKLHSEGNTVSTLPSESKTNDLGPTCSEQAEVQNVEGRTQSRNGVFDPEDYEAEVQHSVRGILKWPEVRNGVLNHTVSSLHGVNIQI